LSKPSTDTFTRANRGFVNDWLETMCIEEIKTANFFRIILDYC